MLKRILVLGQNPRPLKPQLLWLIHVTLRKGFNRVPDFKLVNLHEFGVSGSGKSLVSKGLPASPVAPGFTLSG